MLKALLSLLGLEVVVSDFRSKQPQASSHRVEHVDFSQPMKFGSC